MRSSPSEDDKRLFREKVLAILIRVRSLLQQAGESLGQDEISAVARLTEVLHPLVEGLQTGTDDLRDAVQLLTKQLLIDPAQRQGPIGKDLEKQPGRMKQARESLKHLFQRNKGQGPRIG
jgi:hypothetical protein